MMIMIEAKLTAAGNLICWLPRSQLQLGGSGCSSRSFFRTATLPIVTSPIWLRNRIRALVKMANALSNCPDSWILKRRKINNLAEICVCVCVWVPVITHCWSVCGYFGLISVVCRHCMIVRGTRKECNINSPIVRRGNGTYIKRLVAVILVFLQFSFFEPFTLHYICTLFIIGQHWFYDVFVQQNPTNTLETCCTFCRTLLSVSRLLNQPDCFPSAICAGRYSWHCWGLFGAQTVELLSD